MRKLKLLFASLALVLGGGATWGQMSDVTSAYIANPGFEADGNSAASNANLTITGWTETQSSAGSFNNTETRDAATASSSAFGNKIAPAEGTYYLFYRHGWNGDAGTTATFGTTTTNELPAGVYRLEFKYQQSYNEDSSSKTKTRIKLAAKNGESEVASVTTLDATKDASFKDDGWNTGYFFFKLDDAATINFEFTLYSGGQKRSDFLLDGVRLLKADNPAEPVAGNTADLYLYNEKTGMYLSAGQSWGTHATVDSYGYEVTATLNNGIYTLKTQQYNKYLDGLYMDANAGNWLFCETSAGSGKYYVTQDGYNYMTSNGAGAELINVTTPTDASVWTIVSKADRKAALSSATIDNPVNATFLISDANFSRNVISSVWNGTSKTSDNQTNLNLSGGTNENKCAESYHATFSIKQTLSGLAAGVYSLTAQGFYRQDGSDNVNLPVFYLGSETVTFPLKTGSEGGMSDASTSFAGGSYTTEPIYVRVEADGSVELGAKLEGENYSLWCIWDNFQLKYYGDVTVAAVKMKAFVDAYNAAKTEAEAFTESSMFAADWTALQTAISDNTLDLNDAGLTESQLVTATNNLTAANTAATAAVTKKTTYNTAIATIDGGTNVDLTSLISNPSFETGNTNGWNNDGAISASAQGNKAFDNTQGNYYAERWHATGTIDINQTVEALPAGIYQIEAYMYSDTGDAKLYANTTDVSVSTSAKYTVVVEIADKGSIKFGATCTLTNSTWICIDDFKLTYLGTVDDLTYTLATGKMGTDKAAAQTEAETTFTTTKNLANYNALLAAIADAEASKANYVALKAAIDKAEAVKGANNFVTAAATTALTNEISTATSAWTDVTYTDAEATAEIATLGSAVSGWHAIAIEGKAGAYLASAWGKTSENWWDAPYINTWSTEGDNDGSGFSVPFFEYYTDNDKNLNTNTFTATLTGLVNGCYDVEIWARVQRRSDADFNGDASMITMSVNGGTPVSIMNNTENNVGSGTSVMRLGRYTARGMVTDGTLTLSIDVKLGSNVHWLSWRDVKYTKVAPETVTITDAGYATYCSENALDFLGTGIKVYRATAAAGKVTFHEITSGKVAASNGLLLKGAKGTYEVPVIADGENEANMLTGVLTATDIDAGNFVLLNGAKGVGFYKTTKTFTVGAHTAYIAASSVPSEGRLFIGFDDEEEVTGIRELNSSANKGAIYNMNGVRVEKAKKGLYIQNGKKFVVK